ncbi:HFX_2341 family transcriptional regulator domain-containing protein [Halobellus clavatus]|jgi:hypothetical protein|uniref:CRISPR-associated protein (Cas_Cas02710) n=1 Tax=Halobellus clavatus TaxID=660517 RepID=A0A1H3HXV1_9EURY|nr:DUF6293 family protein [Halobellus clavatus]SDY20313.1 hypothetical protein SAMN04487946_108129 [Halobellus clavatus]
MSDTTDAANAQQDPEAVSFEGLNVSDRVHIVPLGYEYERVTVPAVRMRADRVHLVYHEGDDPDERPGYYEDIHADLRAAGIEIDDDTVCDIFDLYDTLRTIAELIQANRAHDVYVNLAAGGKVTAIAGMIACMVTGEAEPIYVSAAEYGQDKEVPVAKDVTSVSRLPTYPIQAPSRDPLVLLQYIVEEGPVTKQECIEFAVAAGIDPLAQHSADDTRGLYRLLDSHLLDSLRADEYVETYKQGRNKYVQATTEGENTLDAFSYML